MSASCSLSIRQFTSSEAGAWSNAYLISGTSEALLYDVFMLRSDAIRLADAIEQSGKILTMVMISHAHPDHFMGLDVIADRFPRARIVSTGEVVADIRQDGPWMFDLLKGKFQTEAPTRLVTPAPLMERNLSIEDTKLDVVAFGEGESKHLACLHIPALKAFLAADIIYNEAHLYLAEKHIDGWTKRLDELKEFTRGRVAMIYPGHGAIGEPDALIERTRNYLLDFAEAIKTGDAKMAEEHILAKYPDNHVRQFLNVFSLPAYFPQG
jgi:glyoxylase-like metal-dependent hydrolase (beta-lactamase superfamily II)